jgi:hypothetical protein
LKEDGSINARGGRMIAVSGSDCGNGGHCLKLLPGSNAVSVLLCIS